MPGSSAGTEKEGSPEATETQVPQDGDGASDGAADQKPAQEADTTEKQVDTTADATTADGKKEDEGPKSYLEAVELALDQKKEPEQSSSSRDGDVKPVEAVVPAKTDEITPEEAEALKAKADEDKPPPFHDHPRWKQVLKQRDDARSEVEAFKATSEEFKDDHDTVEQMQSYMSENGLNLEEVNTGFEIMALLKAGGTPEGAEKALAALQPYVKNLQTVAGHVLPDDLQERVDAGAIDEESAKELTMARGQASAQSAAADEARAVADTQAKVQTDDQASQNVIMDTVATWQQDWARNDPDYETKAPRVRKELEYRLFKSQQDGSFPADEKAARKFCDDALKEVNEEYKAMQPRLKPIKPLQEGSSSQSSVKPEPTSYLDAVNAGLEMSQRAA